MRIKRDIPFGIKPKFAILVDGETEFWYIQMLKRNEREISVDLKPEIPQRKKLSDQYKKVIELSRDYDKVFWIVDLDVIIRETRSSKKGSKTILQEFKEYFERIQTHYNNITVIINNPCLEYWALLHFEATSKYFDICEGAEKRLKTHLKGYEKTCRYYTKQDHDIYLKLKPNLINAIANSKRLPDFDFKNPYTGITLMHLLFETEEIYSAIKPK